MTLTLPIQLDPNSPPNDTLHVTASGLPVRIYSIDGGGRYPIHGAIFRDGEWDLRSWRADGAYGPPSGPLSHRALDLRDRVPVKRGVWVTWFADDEGNNFLRSYATQAEAKTAEHKWATLRGVTYLKEGDGLPTPAEPPLWVDWAKLPERAKAAAADENGAVWCFEHQPIAVSSGKWLGRVALHAPIDHRLYRLAPGFEWHETLTRRPEVQDD